MNHVFLACHHEGTNRDMIRIPHWFLSKIYGPFPASGILLDALFKKINLIYLLHEVGIWVMSDIVKQSREAQILALGLTELDRGSLKDAIHDLQSPDGMHKPSVSRVWVGDLTHLQLLDLP